MWSWSTDHFGPPGSSHICSSYNFGPPCLSPTLTSSPIFLKYCSLYPISNHGEFHQISPQFFLFSSFEFLSVSYFEQISLEDDFGISNFQTEVSYLQLSFEQLNLEELGSSMFTALWFHFYLVSHYLRKSFFF